MGFGLGILGFSQTNTDLTDSYQPPQTVVNQTVRMLPGFHADSKNVIYNNGGEFIARSENTTGGPVVSPPPTVYTPVNLKNYVYTRTYLAPVAESNNYAPQTQSIVYFDGIGRPNQEIAIKSTPGGNDLVTKIGYDSYGRQDMDYLPMPQQGSTSSAFYDSVSESVGSPLYGSGPYYSKKSLENSPLDRLNATIAPGDWNTNNKKVEYGYLTNENDEVIKFKTSISWDQSVIKSTLYLSDNSTNSSSGYYNANVLYKNKLTDEDGNISYEFKNNEGQTILIRKMLNGSPSVDTYYVYNVYNQLVFVLSPLAVKAIQDDGLGDGDLVSVTSILDPLCYQYHYDGKNRLAEKKIPGKGWEYMIYDKQDRLVATQDAEMGKNKKWLFTKYDKLGRSAFTGIYISLNDYGSSGRHLEQGIADGKGANNVTRDDSLNTTVSNIKLYYNHSGTYPATISELLSINYYDTYPPYNDLPAVGDYDQYGQKFLTQTYSSSAYNPNTQINTKGLTTAGLLKNIVGNTWAKAYTFYDQKARPIYTHSINYLGGYTKTGSLLDFSGTVLKTYTKHKRASAGTIPAEVVINERFIYDHQNRLKQHYHQVDNKPEVLLADNIYDELSRLKTKKIGNELQTLDYRYNILGWVTSVNDPSSDITMGSDLFAYKIRYNEQIAGLPTPNALDYPDLQVKPKYNGNIAEIDWNGVDIGSLEPMPLPYRYGYVYDNLNRLKAGFYQNPYNTAKGEGNEIVDEYDLNGNIVKLKRFAYKSKSPTAQKIDDLVYHYAGNQVTKIDDNSGQTPNKLGYPGGSGTIEYDLNGNMNLMQDKGISSIEYNFLNLPTKIVQTNPTSYSYRADGVKISKLFTVNNDNGTVTVRTEYFDGFQYNSNLDVFGRGILRSDDPETLSSATANQIETFRPLDDEESLIGGGTGPELDMTMSLQFFPTAEGFYDYKNSKYIYQYKDHLGNVRLSYARNTETNQPEVLDRNDYYPFGMNISEYYSVFDAQGTPFNYKYNGKELQESGMYDYGARLYMPDIGRWGVVDELAETSRRWSPYTYAYNNPIIFIDPDGRHNSDFDRMIYDWAAGINTSNGNDSSGSKPNDWYQNNQTRNIEWKDTNKPVKGFTSLGRSNMIGTSNNGQERTYYLNANGSATEKTNYGDTTGHVEDGKTMKMITGNTITSSATSVSGLSAQISYNQKLLGPLGVTGSLGYVADSYTGASGGKFYYSFGWSMSNSSGVSLEFNTIKATDPNTLFKVSDFKGFGNSFTSGFGGAFSWGGSSMSPKFFGVNNTKSQEWGAYPGGYSTFGFSYGLAKPAFGTSFSRTKTNFFKK